MEQHVFVYPKDQGKLIRDAHGEGARREKQVHRYHWATPKRKCYIPMRESILQHLEGSCHFRISQVMWNTSQNIHTGQMEKQQAYCVGGKCIIVCKVKNHVNGEECNLQTFHFYRGG